ncbi:aminotransferase class I/II-fold pyridoxal phosphate-dependent enzyme [Streptomyces sp. Tu 3180]|uniref:MalY/PatB family protein n=1 Tax=Streptomyces sp. Tu 3180 TaxID=2682611 RepID=UPI00135A9D4F|nr:aminotransferase class I/II-fold pyridoxal phosphate-dependent enzyme [Streptomyces sp. Tu 3180]KAF3468033.1 aminotransferase class I/II-fold pyridoxal phosphate-dependent enzyme [Streptomyces sp. Tu 3180]
MRLVALTDRQLRAGPGLKWGRARPDVIPADIAELDFAVAPPIRAVLRDAVTRSHLGYPDYTAGTPVRLAELFARRMRAKHGWQPDPGAVEICAQITQALCCAVLAYTRAGDQVLVHTPTYPPFLEAIRSLGRRPVLLPVANHGDARAAESWAAVERERRIRLIVLCQPHNPTGHVFDTATLEVIARLAVRRDAVIFSDEIHAEIVYEGADCPSIASVPDAAERSVVFTSAAKTFNIAGLRCAVGHFGSAALHDLFRAMPWHLRSGAGALGVTATITAWESCDEWLDQLRARLSVNRTIVSDFLSHVGRVRFLPPAATYLAWIDLRDVRALPDVHTLLLNEGKISLQPGTVFGPSLEGFVRLNFGTSGRRLRVILERFYDALETCNRKGPEE